jgi:hypothetical protein
MILVPARRRAGLAPVVLLAVLAGCRERVPTPVVPGKTRIECRAGAVALLGSFDGWAARRPLTASGDGAAADVDLPAGRTAIACLRADGSVEPPLNAPEVEDDGFGGKNGVFDTWGQR